jgi:predicted nucleic acid-binding protein
MILLDADVLLDVAMNREPHVGPSAGLLRRLERHGRMAFVSWHTLANVYYLMRPIHGGKRVRGFLEHLTKFAVVATADTDAFRYAVSLDLPDLEDAMLVGAAYGCGARWIATRNLKDFRKSPIPARTPAQLLAEISA